MKAFENVVTGSYKDCQKAWNKAIGTLEKREWVTYGGDVYGEWAQFSSFDTVDDTGEDWIVKYPDFEGNPLICEGELKVIIDDWDKAEIVLTDPRINDVFRFFANNHDGHHGFLEDVMWIDEYKALVLICGS